MIIQNNIFQLCRGIELRPESVTKNLYCYYGDRNKPQYRSVITSTFLRVFFVQNFGAKAKT